MANSFLESSSWADAVRRDSSHWAGAARRTQAESTKGDSKLAVLLIEWAAWGLISFPMLQQAAEAAQFDGLQHAHIQRLSSLGGPNSWPGNMRRDLMRQQQNKGLPQPSQLLVPFVPSRGERLVRWMRHPVFLPHVMFHFISTIYPGFLDELLKPVGPHE